MPGSVNKSVQREIQRLLRTKVFQIAYEKVLIIRDLGTLSNQEGNAKEDVD